MKSYFRSLPAMALLACAVLAGAFHDIVITPVVAVVRVAKRLAVWLVFDCVAKLGAQLRALPAAMTATRVKAFYLRIVRRQRVVLTPGWRMCPST